jgi:hypothetical protein
MGMTRYVAAVEITDSARKHGIADEDMRHATRMPFRLVAQGDDRVLVIGPDRNGNLLEVVVFDPDGDAAIIHADELRPKFYVYLKG